MGRKAFARARRALRFRAAHRLFHLRFDGCHAGFDFVEDESVLLLAQRTAPQPFGAAAEARPLQHLHHRRQSCDPFLGAFVDQLEMDVALLQKGGFFGHGNNHRLERVNVVREREIGCRHGQNQSIFAGNFPAFSAP